MINSLYEEPSYSSNDDKDHFPVLIFLASSINAVVLQLFRWFSAQSLISICNSITTEYKLDKLMRDFYEEITQVFIRLSNDNKIFNSWSQAEKDFVGELLVHHGRKFYKLQDEMIELRKWYNIEDAKVALITTGALNYFPFVITVFTVIDTLAFIFQEFFKPYIIK